MAGSTRKPKQSHKEGTISQGHYALKSPLGFLHLFSFTTKTNASSLLPMSAKKLLNLIYLNLSYDKPRNEVLSNDVTRGRKRTCPHSFTALGPSGILQTRTRPRAPRQAGGPPRMLTAGKENSIPIWKNPFSSFKGKHKSL